MTRLNDSIRPYVWAILGSRAQTHSNILSARTGFDAQKQFLANVEDSISSPVDIPSSIAHYQKMLQYASTPLDFVFGIGLYLSPSDMALHPGNVQGYNNEIIIARSDAVIGHNLGINESDRHRLQATAYSKDKSPHRPGLLRGGHRVLRRMLRKSHMLRRNMQRSARASAATSKGKDL